MRMIIGMNNHTSSDIIMPNKKVISRRIQIICFKLKGINPLFVLIKPSEMKLFLDIHDLNPTCFISSSKYIAIFSYGNSRNVLEESVDLTDGLFLVGINYFYVTTLTQKQQVFCITV